MEAPPDSRLERSLRSWKRVAWIGAVLLVAPILGWLGTMAGMLASFRRIEESAAPTPEDLAEGVYTSLFAMTAGFALGGMGAALFLVALFRMARLRRAAAEPLEGEPWR